MNKEIKIDSEEIKRIKEDVRTHNKINENH